MRRSILVGACLVAIFGACAQSRADIVVQTSGLLLDGKIISQSDKEIVFQPDGTSDTAARKHFEAASVLRVLKTDEHGALLSDSSAKKTPPRWNVPPAPTAPPILPPKSQPTYYVIPLHGEVGSTVLASALEQSLADAIRRKPTVIVLDIDSPGGLVEEAEKIMKVLHRYNKQARIVALTDQDLSAAAILSLSVREIYVKSSSTIGAATSYQPTNLKLPPKLEEKMQSAWRAVARNSAEEGNHEPLLAEAMIDNDMELHLEKIDGKAIVKEGPGDRELCRKGKILTLSSHEAIECGLASGEADDLDELGKVLRMPDWSECKGLGTLLADYVPKKAEVLKTESQQIIARFNQNMQKAKEMSPTDELSEVVVQRIPVPVPGPRRIIPGRPGVYYRQQTTVYRNLARGAWKPRSMQCVVALQQAEENLKEEVQLCKAFGQEGAAEIFDKALTEIGAIRARIYDDRDKYGTGSEPSVAASNRPQPAGQGAGPAGQHSWEPPHINDRKMPPGASKSEMLGGTGGGPYVHANPTGGPVLGFHYTTGSWNDDIVVRDFDPIYERPPVDVSDNPNIVLAKKGYAVAGLMVQTDSKNILGVQVIFAKLADGRLDMSDSYKGNWIATPGQSPEKLAGDGRLVIGTFGRKGLNMDAMGLVTAAPSDSK